MDIFDYPYYIDLDCIKEWLSLEGTNINSVNVNKQTLLHLNAMRGYIVVCEFLINNGANVHIRDIFDETCYHDAERGGHEYVKELLLKAGADPYAKTGRYL